MYTPYATEAEYAELFPDASPVSSEALRTASRHIDSLTFNRINAAGFDSLTAFQKDIIKEVTCRQAMFESENEDMISSVLSSYSINGVSMSFGESWNVYVQDGIAMPRSVYALLEQSGLCCRMR